MKHKLILIILGVLVLVSLHSQNGQTDTLYHEINAQLMVEDRKESADAISSWAESRGGYYTIKSLDRLTLRLPDEHLEELSGFLAGVSSEILDYSQNAYDLRENIMMNRSALEAREELLERNLEYLDQSDLQGTLTLEQEIRRLMQEIDALKGSLRNLENNSVYARVDLYISFKNQAVPEGRPSRFDWINSVGFYDFMQSSQYGQERGRRGPALPLPEGFALSGERPWYRAVSPEGVQIRLKSVANYPEQTQDFWSKALFTTLEGLGYISLNDQRDYSPDDETAFQIRRWGVPYGRRDYIYLTGLRLNRGKLEILEIAGEAEYMENYFPAGE